jgi:ATP-dependent DNA helicase RecG
MAFADSVADQWEIVQPDIVTSVENMSAVLRVEPKYPLTQGLSNHKMRSVVNSALLEVEHLNDWLDYKVAYPDLGYDWPTFREAFDCIHNPQKAIDLLPSAPSRSRLAFDELVVTHLELLSSSAVKSFFLSYLPELSTA